MQCMYLAMYGENVSLGSAVFISIFAMLVVFVILLLISFMIDMTAFVLKCMAKKKNNATIDVKNEKINEKVDNTIDVAVIAAAVAAYLGTNVNNIRIKKIRRINQKTSSRVGKIYI